MAKGGKRRGAKRRKVTLKMAMNAVRVTPDGRRRLDLSNMGIATFPECLLKLPDLEELDLSRNQLKKLPGLIGDLVSLRWLDLHSNQLEVLPETLGQLVALSHLNLSNNRLTSAGLPHSLGNLTCLQSLNLGINRLDTLPATMVGLCSLQELGLFDNLLTTLPECIKVLPSITRLNTKRNLFSQGYSGDRDGPEEAVYLAKERSLCGSCLKRCKEERRWMLGGGKRRGGEGDGEARGGPYSGLITPNSVAQANQEQWRLIVTNQGPGKGLPLKDSQ
ncbi:leucine-rich repeat-containing protein 18 [Esox lucius]|uniref:Leucine rich repeat containing 18a n=1 Tax=Esox lucius TaxID=8010 RepID=A0A6Q2XZR4_ESOLU|nr:leucine-rich repeat-containing protein 18 [Esox lucius]XP_019902985.2 leucine-rich repeat-containing protein 18 [Esox lucius]